jgi:hypothetical protein
MLNRRPIPLLRKRDPYEKNPRKHQYSKPKTNSPEEEGKPITTPNATKPESQSLEPKCYRNQPERKERWWDRFTNDIGMLALAFLSLSVLIVYTGYTRQLVVDTEVSYTVVQRAFVSLLPIESDVETVEGGERKWTFISSAENSGTTPTKNMTFFQIIPCIPSADGHTQVMVATAPDTYCNVTADAGGKIVPLGPPDDPEIAYKTKWFRPEKYSLGPRGHVILGEGGDS